VTGQVLLLGRSCVSVTVPGMTHTTAPASSVFSGASRTFAARFLLGLLAVSVALPAQAWGPLGHRLVARLAEDDLSPQTRAAIAQLLQGEADPSLAGIATWADNLRGSDPGLGRRSASWHYVNIGESGCVYEAARDCPRGNCVVAAIEAQTRILADPRNSRERRLNALKFVVHFVGDVHQPLHAGHAHDRGGNDYQVNFRARGSNLHAFWDSGLLNAKGLDEDAWLARLRQLPAPPAHSPVPVGAAQAWAEQSCRITLAPGFYPQGHVLDEAYVARHAGTIEQQLRDGGARLAAVLNGALGHG